MRYKNLAAFNDGRFVDGWFIKPFHNITHKLQHTYKQKKLSLLFSVGFLQDIDKTNILLVIYFQDHLSIYQFFNQFYQNRPGVVFCLRTKLRPNSKNTAPDWSLRCHQPIKGRWFEARHRPYRIRALLWVETLAVFHHRRMTPHETQYNNQRRATAHQGQHICA